MNTLGSSIKINMRLRLMLGIIAIAMLFLFSGVFAYFYHFYMLDVKHVESELLKKLDLASRRMDILISETAKNSGQPFIGVEYSEYRPEGDIFPAERVAFRGNFIQAKALILDLSGFDLGREAVLERGKICLFLRLFLSNKKTYRELNISDIGGVPRAYRISGVRDMAQESVWKKIWDYALDSENNETIKILNVTLRPHDGILREGLTYSLILDSNGELNIDYPYYTNITPKR
jgi:hypothetical protein